MMIKLNSVLQRRQYCPINEQYMSINEENTFITQPQHSQAKLKLIGTAYNANQTWMWFRHILIMGSCLYIQVRYEFI